MTHPKHHPRVSLTILQVVEMNKVPSIINKVLLLLIKLLGEAVPNLGGKMHRYYRHTILNWLIMGVGLVVINRIQLIILLHLTVFQSLTKGPLGRAGGFGDLGVNIDVENTYTKYTSSSLEVATYGITSYGGLTGFVFRVLVGKYMSITVAKLAMEALYNMSVLCTCDTLKTEVTFIFKILRILVPWNSIFHLVITSSTWISLSNSTIVLDKDLYTCILTISSKDLHTCILTIRSTDHVICLPILFNVLVEFIIFEGPIFLLQK